jgi:RimJ/RimL family protein N-acetyltransferase
MDEAEEIFFDATCPHCRRTLSFPERTAGIVQDCPLCNEILVVPRDKAAMAGKLPLPIMTSRLRLRPLVLADAGQLAAFICDPALFDYCEQRLTAPEEIEPAIDGPWSNLLTREEGRICLAMEMADQIVGLVWFSYLDHERVQGSVFVVVNPKFQRRGLGGEAVTALLGFGFAGINLHRLVATCDRRNAAACRMLEKAGMRREGEFVQDRLLRGEWVNTVAYAMLDTEFGRPPAVSRVDTSREEV